MPAAIEIYTRPGCGYCSAAKSLLARKKAEFTEYDSGMHQCRQEMFDRVGAGATFPQIFIDKTLSAAATTFMRWIAQASSTR